MEAALLEEWRAFEAHIKRDIERVEAFEVKLKEGVNLHKKGQDRQGALMLQREIGNNLEIRKLR